MRGLPMTQSQALLILKTGANVFLTGEPGAGKTHTINEYVAYLRAQGIEPAVTASTGIAATHINGMTIHSWSGIGIRKELDKYDLDKIASTEYISKRVRRAEVLVIDEVSMLAPEVLSMVDVICREIKQNFEPFGGIQIVLVSDFFQLPPIVKEDRTGNSQMAFLEEPRGRFAYNSPVWKKSNFIVCYLTEQHRQDDKDFLDLLSAIRSNIFDDNHLQHIKARKIERTAAPAGVPKLFSHNIDVDRVNDEILAKLPGKPEAFTMSSQGPDAIVAALKRGCLSPEKLYLKIGAAVMFTKNNLKEGFVNGTIGVVEGFDDDSDLPVVKTKSGRRIEVSTMDWAIEEGGKIKARIAQLPLRLAWAITVHKSQGMSLDEAVMDLSTVFEFGQGYVALSRVRRLSGLYLLGWNDRAFQVHPEVLAKDMEFRSQSEEAADVFDSMSKEEIGEMHRKFVIACGGKFIANIKEGAPKVRSAGKLTLSEKREQRWECTLALVRSGKNLADAAETLGLTGGTVLKHLEELRALGRLSSKDVSHLAASLEHELDQIQDAFRDLGIDKLSPVFSRFGGEFSYDELRIARLLIDK